MTTVTIYNDKTGTHKGFVVKGHSGYSRSGRDIVCSAVSILTTNTINSIEKYAEDPISYDTNEKGTFIRLEIKENTSHDAQLLIDSMILGLSHLAKAYPKNVRLMIEEV